MSFACVKDRRTDLYACSSVRTDHALVTKCFDARCYSIREYSAPKRTLN